MDELLEYLRYKTGCMYMSDLSRFPWRLPNAVRNIPDNKYPVTEWNEAIGYILHVNTAFETVGDAKRYIFYGEVEQQPSD